MEIEAQTKLYDLLQHYPELEVKIVQIAPPFKNLKNPVLRKTVGKLATLEKVARIGNLEVLDFINMLRRETGQSELKKDQETTMTWQEGEPAWIKMDPQAVVDGTEMLNRGEHPLKKVNELMHQIEKGCYLLLKTNFKPIPLIEEMEKQKYQVYSKTDNNDESQYFTYIRVPIGNS